MSNTTTNLKLTLPLGSCYWNYDTWDDNMEKLDEGYLHIHDRITANLTASNITCSNAKSDGKLVSTNCQDMFEEMRHKLSGVKTYTVVSDITIPIAVYAHNYIILTFGDTVPNVTFTKSLPTSENDFEWINGYPLFEPNSSYELSFLRLACIWAKRDFLDWSQFFEYYIENDVVYITSVKADVWYNEFHDYDFIIPQTLLGYPVMID